MSGKASDSMKGGWGLCTEPPDHKERTEEPDSWKHMGKKQRGLPEERPSLAYFLYFKDFLFSLLTDW